IATIKCKFLITTSMYECNAICVIQNGKHITLCIKINSIRMFKFSIHYPYGKHNAPFLKKLGFSSFPFYLYDLFSHFYLGYFQTLQLVRSPPTLLARSIIRAPRLEWNTREFSQTG